MLRSVFFQGVFTQNTASPVPSPRVGFCWVPHVEIWNPPNQWSFYQSVFCFVRQFVERAILSAYLESHRLIIFDTFVR